MKTTGMISLLLAVAGAAITAPAVTYAGTVVYEPFNYPSLSDGAVFASGDTGATTTANATGLTGPYTASTSWAIDAQHTQPHDVVYDASGLSFPGMQTMAGSITVNAPTDGWGATALSVELAAGATVNGNTLYAGYLFNPAANNAQNGWTFGIGEASSGNYVNNGGFDINRNGGMYGFGGTGATKVTTPIFPATTNTGTAVTPGTTYLQLFEVTGINASSGSISMTDWVLTNSQYQYFLANGGLSASNLDNNPTQVLQTGSVTIANPTAYPQFNNGTGSNYMDLMEYDQSTTFDEIRLSGTSLADVAPASAIPEPATLGLMAVAGAGLLLIGRRRLT